uniref:FBA_2 domain-containing protein n=1 Tax=Caenorhabditis tropicalis TaxID=1561998 RepID=A0A1I7TUK0_9PELO
MTSSRAKKLVTNFSGIKSRFHMTLDIEDKPRIIIKGDEMHWIYYWVDKDPSFFYSYDSIYTVSESRMEDCMKWFERINGVLGKRFNKANLWILNKSITDWLRSQQDSFDDVLLYDCRHQDAIYFLSNIKVFRSLVLLIRNYNKKFRIKIPEGLTHLTLRNASYLEFKQFMKFKHQEIVLCGSGLTNREINRFLESWIACKSHLQLKYLKIRVPGPETMDVIMDLPFEMTTDPNILRKFKSSPFNVNASEAFNIKRCDGKMATLCVKKIWDDWHICFLVH